MRFAAVLALLSAPLLVFSQDNPNPFKIPAEGLSATGGEPLKLEWEPTTDGTVSLILRQGNSADLEEGTVIASKIDNSGSYTWTPSNSLTRGTDYTIEIVSDDNPDQTNYTPYFTLDTTTSTPQTTSKITLGAPSSTSSSGATVPIHNTFTHSTGTTKVDTITGSSPTGGANAASSTAAPNSGAKATAMAAGIFGVALGALAL